ncbi:MAG: hypothetical protein ACJASR_001145 [Psychroserpens sp.]|jgi:hypothetical protein
MPTENYISLHVRKTKFSNLLYCSILLWIFLLSGNYNFFGVGIYPPLYLSLLSPFFWNKKLLFDFRLLLLFGLIFLTISLSSIIIYRSESITIMIYIRFFFKTFMFPLLSGIFIAGLIRKMKFDSQDISKMIVLVFVFQIILTVIQLTNESFRTIFFSMVELAPNWKLLAENGHFRATGLAGLSIYDTSISYALLALLLSPLAKGTRNYERLFFIIGILSSIILCLISGRTGFILLTITLMHLFWLCPWKRHLTIFIIFAISCSYLFVMFIIGLDDLNFALKFMLKPFISLVQTGTVVSSSTTQLFDEYIFMPWSVNPIFGDGVWAQPSVAQYLNYKYRTDSGILLFFIAFGVFGLVLCVSMFLSYLFYFKVIFFQYGKTLYNYISYSCFILISMFLLLKAPFILSEKVISTLIFTIIFLHIKNNSPRFV